MPSDQMRKLTLNSQGPRKWANVLASGAPVPQPSKKVTSTQTRKGRGIVVRINNKEAQRDTWKKTPGQILQAIEAKAHEQRCRIASVMKLSSRDIAPYAVDTEENI